MTRWRKQIRIGMVAVAAFVILVTVLPQVASGIGLGGLANRLSASTPCSGSSGGSGSSGSSGSSCCSGGSGSSNSGSSGCATGPGTVSGTVSLTGAPAGFSPGLLGAGACPYLAPGQPLCATPVFSLQYGTGYSLSLDPGKWVVYGFYEISFLSGAFLGGPHTVTIKSGANLVVNPNVPYVPPATLDVTVTVQSLPVGIPITSSYVVLCPVGIPYDGVTQSIACVNNSQYFQNPAPTPGASTLTGLPAGRWTAYPGYCTMFGCAANPHAGAPVTTVAGSITKVHLTTPFLVPPSGQLTATVSVSGAPAGFADPIGLMACQVYSFGSSCIGTGGLTVPTSLILGDGVWEVRGYYTVAPFGNAVSGPVHQITIKGGRTTNLALVVPYQVLGTAAGSIKLAGLPANVHPTSYTVTACPANQVDPFNFVSCVSEYSGTGGYVYGAADTKRFGRTAHRGTLPKAIGTGSNSYNLPTLTPGPWQIQVSYTTPFGSFYSPITTTVDITAGKTTRTMVTIPYQVPQFGLVTGKLTLIGVPGFGISSGVRACSSAPVAGSCTNEVDSYTGAGGLFNLQLLPGTWWVEGVVYLYTGPTTQVITSTPARETVTPGSVAKVYPTVKGS